MTNVIQDELNSLFFLIFFKKCVPLVEKDLRKQLT